MEQPSAEELHSTNTDELHLRTQSAISTKLFLALGFMTVTAIVAGLASILALNRFQDNFNALINAELPTLEDTSHINQLSVTLANRGASLIISPNTWTRVTLMGQVNDDAQWLEEIIARLSNENLSDARKQELLSLRDQLFETYTKLNALTENRIMQSERLNVIDGELIAMQQHLIDGHFKDDVNLGTSLASDPLHNWHDLIHKAIFDLMQARRIKHTTPLDRLQVAARATLNKINMRYASLQPNNDPATVELLQRLTAVAEGPRSVFAVKRGEIIARAQIEATLKTAKTIAERFMSASELATSDIRASISSSNKQTSRAMDITLQAMVGFILVSALVAIATFLYVSRTVLRRLVNLRRSMVAHAEGTSDKIDTSGDDEITDMARALRYLVDTLHSREVGLRHAKEEAENASIAKTRFLAAASHDLRQPLQALNLFVYALEGKEKDEEKREIINLIRNSLDSLKELLNTLLDISKLEAGVVHPNIKDFSVGPMIDRIRSELTAIAWASDLELRTVSSSAEVHCDPSLLETILRNLVDNAIKYTDKGRVLVGCRQRGEWIRFEVWDTGPGIPEDQHELIFQDFYQIDNEARKRTQGLGLGLSIVRRMAALLGCTIGCESRPGKGAMFWVLVPQSTSQHNLNRRLGMRDVDTRPDADVGHIALIEDDEQVLMGLKSLLETKGYSTVTFHDANPATIEAAFADASSRPDLIIADYRLEGKTTGREAVQIIRNVFDVEIPAIIITGDTAPERLRESKKSGLPILHKPVRPEELIETVRKALLAQDPDDATEGDAKRDVLI